jgi:hypothetical protein
MEQGFIGSVDDRVEVAKKHFNNKVLTDISYVITELFCGRCEAI